MNENQVSGKDHITFEKIRQRDESGSEYWSARDLQPVLEYGSWDKFKRVIEKTMLACEQSGHSIDDHFSHMGKMVKIGSGASRFLDAVSGQLSKMDVVRIAPRSLCLSRQFFGVYPQIWQTLPAESSSHSVVAVKVQKRGLMQKLLTGQWRVNHEN